MFDEHYQQLREAYRVARYNDFVSAFAGPETPSAVAASATSDQLVKQMQDFLLANGRDLEDLNRFTREVDTDLASSFLPS